MRPFEKLYLGVEPFLPPLHRQVRRTLLDLARAHQGRLDVLDVGGRKSHYTIGVPARISISDIERKTEIQKNLHLGITSSIAAHTMRRRSNVRWVLLDDMTQSSLKAESFDVVVAVEVLEHVERDADFLREVRRVLRPGGAFVMTTPNGDFIAVNNPDHKRHYTRRQLEDALERCFSAAQVRYAVKGGRFRKWGLKPWSPRRPGTTVLSMVSNVVNGMQSAIEKVAEMKIGTHHLFAIARK